MTSLACLAMSVVLAVAPAAPDPKSFDRVESLFFNDSLEELVLNQVERASMKRIGLDPNDLDDHRLLAFVIRGFHYRYYASQTRGDEADLGVYVYNLGSVKIGQPIPVLDASALETVQAEQIGPTLHALFDPIRKSGAPRVMVAYSLSRTGEKWWRRVFINAFAAQVQFAHRGELRFTKAADSAGPLATLSHPVSSLTDLDFSFEGERGGQAWRLEQTDVPVRISGKRPPPK